MRSPVCWPAVAGPWWEAGSSPRFRVRRRLVRLMNLALVPLVLGATAFLGPARLHGRTLFQMGALVALASFHRRLTAAGAWLLEEPLAFLLVQAAAAADIGMLLVSERRRALPNPTSHEVLLAALPP